MQTALLEFVHQMERVEPFLVAILVFFLALIAMIYMFTLRRIRFDLRYFGECLNRNVRAKGPGSVPIQFRSRDVKRISDQMNHTLQAHSLRVSKILEYMKMSETKLDNLARASTFLSNATQEQDRLLKELHQLLHPQTDSLQKLSAETTAKLANTPLTETEGMLSSTIEKMGTALDRTAEATAGVKSLEEIAHKLQNLARRLQNAGNETRDLSLNARLAISHSPGSSVEYAVTSGAETLEKTIERVMQDLLSECNRIREIAEKVRTAQRAGNLRLLDASQGVEEARRDIREFAARLHSDSQQMADELNAQHEQLRKVFSVLGSLRMENQKTITVSERSESISADVIETALKVREELHLSGSRDFKAPKGSHPAPPPMTSLLDRVSELSKPERSSEEN